MLFPPAHENCWKEYYAKEERGLCGRGQHHLDHKRPNPNQKRVNRAAWRNYRTFQRGTGQAKFSAKRRKLTHKKLDKSAQYDDE